MDNSGGLGTAEVLDTKTEQFTALKPMSKPRWFAPTAISEHKLYCFGGFIGFNSVELFNFYSGEWEDAKYSTEFRVSFSAVTFDE